MHVEDIVASDLVSNLTRRFNEGLRFDVADGSTNLSDDYIRSRGVVCLQTHASLDFIRDVRDDLNRVTEIFTATFALNHGRVDLSGGYVSCLTEIDVEKTLVVTDVEICFCTVIGYKNFAVLKRVHCARVNV